MVVARPQSHARLRSRNAPTLAVAIAAFIAGAASHLAIAAVFRFWIALGARAAVSEFLIAHGLSFMSGPWSMFHTFVPDYVLAACVGGLSAVVAPRRARVLALAWGIGSTAAAVAGAYRFGDIAAAPSVLLWKLGTIVAAVLPTLRLGAARALSAGDGREAIDSIELHDSHVAIAVVGDSMMLHLRPAYVHHWERTAAGWRGIGRSQSADLEITSGALSAPCPSGMLEISDGWFEVAGRRYDNEIPVPLRDWGAIRGQLILVNAETIELHGEGLTVSLVGEPTDIEALPLEWAPS